MPRKPKPKSASKPKRKTEKQRKAEREAAKVRIPKRGYKPKGRPSLMHDGVIPMARLMTEQGALKTEIADAIGVSYRTLRNWELQNKDLFHALNADEVVLTNNVERSVYQRATGYEFAAEKVFQYQGEIVRAATIEHCPPDIGAAKFWLTNRAPDRWQERTVRDVNATVTVAHTFEEYLSLVHGKSAPALEVVAEAVKDES